MGLDFCLGPVTLSGYSGLGRGQNIGIEARILALRSDKANILV